MALMNSNTTEIKLAEPFKITGKKVWVAGASGMVGGALVRRLASEDCEVLTPSHRELDLIDQAAVNQWLAANKPDVVVIAAATVGGILANSTRPAEFIYNNIAIESNIIAAAHQNNVEKLLFLGSACIYPREATQPMVEEALLTGPLEPTNEWYAIAKIVGIKMCEAYRQQYGCDFISAQPNNLYGPGDNFDLESSHVIPALMHKAHIAKINGDQTMPIWGSDQVFREFLHVDDCADALVHLIKYYSGAIHVNMGTGEEVTIKELAEIIAKVVGFEGELEFDTSKPDGSPRKLLDSSRMQRLGWTSTTSLEAGLATTYQWFLENISD